MKLSRVPVKMYKKFFIILLCVFVGAFVLEFVTAMLGHPINNISINNVRIEPDSPVNWLILSIATAFIFGGIANFFLTVRIIKEALRLDHWPAYAVVVMTVLFVLEMIVGAIMLIPNIIIFGLKGRIKNRIYEVDFR